MVSINVPITYPDDLLYDGSKESVELTLKPLLDFTIKCIIGV